MQLVGVLSGYCFNFGEVCPTNVYMHTYTYTHIYTDTVMLNMKFCLLNMLILVRVAASGVGEDKSG